MISNSPASKLPSRLPSRILLVQPSILGLKGNAVKDSHPNKGDASLEPSIQDFWVGFPAFLNKYGVLHYDIAGLDVLNDPNKLALYGIILLPASSFSSLSEVEIQPILHALEKFHGSVICEGPIPESLFSLSGIQALQTKETLSFQATAIHLAPVEEGLNVKINSALSDVKLYEMPLMSSDHSVLLGIRQFIQDPIPALETLPKGSIRWFFQRLMYQYHHLYESVLHREQLALLTPEFVDVESIDASLILFLSYLRADKSFSPQAETAMAQKMIGWVQEVLPLNEAVREASFLPISLERGARLMLLKLVADTPSRSMNQSLQTYQQAIQEWIGVPEVLPGHSLIGYLKEEAYGVWSSLCETFQAAFKALQDGKSRGGFSTLISSLIFSKVRKRERMQDNAMAEEAYQALSHLVVRVWFLKQYDENFSGQSPLFLQLLNVLEGIPWEKQLNPHQSSHFFKQSVPLTQDISFFSLALCLYGQLGNGEKVKTLGTEFLQTYFDWENFYFTQFPLQKATQNKLSRLVWVFECIGVLRDVEKESAHPEVGLLEKSDSMSSEQGDFHGDLTDGEDIGGLFFESQNGSNIKKFGKEFSKELWCEPPPGFSTEKDPYAQLDFPFQSVELSPGSSVLLNAFDGKEQALGPACVQFGKWLSFPFPVFSILAHGHYVPSLPGSYKGLTVASNNLGAEVLLGTLLLEFIQKQGVPMPLVYPWPEHAKSCFTLRRDVDRPLTHRQFLKLLKADHLL
ncbi:MAG: hypothetical protein K2X66_06705, partial [Cyanobacteria bacterium]|nr:hypothetical protein [Cyanobacteriota bacterium]